MLYTYFDAVTEVVYRNGSLRAYFLRDTWRVEAVRMRFDANQVLLFKGVLREGMEAGLFRIDDVDMTGELLYYCVKGIEAPYIRGHVGSDLDDSTLDVYVRRLVLRALGVNL